MPIFFGATLTVSGIDLSAVPHQLTDFAQLMFGLVLGARYERAFFARDRMFIPFALINSLFIMVASVVAAAFLAWAFSLPIDDDHCHFARRFGRDDDNCAGAANQRSFSGCLSLVSGGDG
jgi:hypothetical protein